MGIFPDARRAPEGFAVFGGVLWWRLFGEEMDEWMNGWMDGEGGSREEEWQGKRGVDGLVLMGSLGSR